MESLVANDNNEARRTQESDDEFRVKLTDLLTPSCESYADAIITYGIKSSIELRELARNENDRDELVAALLRKLGSSKFSEFHQMVIKFGFENRSLAANEDNRQTKPDPVSC